MKSNGARSLCFSLVSYMRCGLIVEVDIRVVAPVFLYEIWLDPRETIESKMDGRRAWAGSGSMPIAVSHLRAACLPWKARSRVDSMRPRHMS